MEEDTLKTKGIASMLENPRFLIALRRNKKRLLDLSTQDEKLFGRILKDIALESNISQKKIPMQKPYK
jgi:hypothetical protein